MDFFIEPVVTFLTTVVRDIEKLKCDVFLNMVLVRVGVVVEMFGEALRLVLTQVLLKKKGLTLNPITTLYYITPCMYLILTYLEHLNYCSICEFDMLI
jgi:hypothetical protein